MLDKFKEKVIGLRNRVFDYESLESEPEERGAQPRVVTQSQTKKANSNVPEERNEKGRVLQYLSNHQEAVTHSKIARGSGISAYKAKRITRELVDGGIVEIISSRPRYGTVYQIIGGGPNPSKVAPQVPSGSETEDIDFVNITSDLIWSFIRATRSTDVLMFLTWLEQEAGKSES